ncbi:MAG: MerR family transcriptional regulator [Actinobacteria bacterium]|nr:MerR family transcriptional regulator [Actinomycetota bacterium]
MSDASLTIGDLAERTGVGVATLRAWEARFGFPQPVRLQSGHRRYRERDVATVGQVTRARRGGLSLGAAIAMVHDSGDVRPPSVFGAVRQRHRGLTTHVLAKPAMTAISRAIEDEWMSASGRGLVVGSFQRVEFFRRSGRKWRELARTADHAIALADFPRRRLRRGQPYEVPLPAEAPLLREWAVLVDGPHLAAMVAGWERHGGPASTRAADRRRRFEAVWTTDPAVVRTGIEAALEQAQRSVGASLDGLAESLPPVVDDPAVALERGMALANRIVGYLA